MGKGDKKTTKGKRVIGSHGITRPKNKKSTVAPVVKAEKPVAEKKEKAVKKEPVAKKVTEKKEPVKKPAVKKEPVKKTEE